MPPERLTVRLHLAEIPSAEYALAIPQHRTEVCWPVFHTKTVER